MATVGVKGLKFNVHRVTKSPTFRQP